MSTSSNDLTVCSLFSGIGGIDLGFSQAGFNVVWANDNDKAACRTYRHNWTDTKLVEGDIRKIDKSSIPRCNIVIAGFPCQPFSLAGPHRGFEDKRGSMFFQIIEVVRTHKPEVVFLENVANLIDHDEGKTFITMFNAFAELDYTIRYRTLSAHEYGNTPQTRNRTYIVAFRDQDLCDRFRFPEPINLTRGIFDVINRDKKQKDIYYFQSGSKFYDYMVSQVKRNDSIYRVHDSGIHLAKNQTCPTLTATMGTKENYVPIVIDNFGYRKLTIRECLDFQGFPESFSFPNETKINEAYKQIGNSVCVSVIRRIAEQIKKVLED